MSEIQTNFSAQIQKNSILFTNLYQLLQTANQIIIICGPAKAGKSVTVDLLTDKVLQKVENEDDLKKYVAEENNFNAEYNNIYFQFFQNSKTLILEGLTLNLQKKNSKVNLIKALFIRTCLQANKKIAFVMVLDQTKRQQLEEVNKLLQHFIQCLNIQDQIAIIKVISQNVYLLLTKTEQDNAAEQFLQNCEVIQQQTQHEGIKFILTNIRIQQKVFMFPNNDPETDLGKRLRESFQTKQIQKSVLQKLSQKLNKIEIKPAFINLLQKYEVQETINTFEKLLKMLDALAVLLLQKTQDNKTYQTAKTNLYKDYFDKSLLIQDLKKTTWEDLKKLNPKQKINKDTIKSSSSKKKGYLLLIEYISTILKVLESKATVKNQYNYFIGTLIFIKYLAPYINEELISKNMVKLIQSTRNLQLLYGQNQMTIRQRTKQTPMLKVIKKPVQKKGVNKAVSIFKEEVKNLRNNEEFIKFIINKIKQKEVLNNFEPNDVIYHIKCLRELLQSYDTLQKLESCYFIEELLDIYAFNENLYEFQTNLKKYIQKKEIPLSSVQKLIKKADQLKNYQSQIRLINYAIAHTFEENQFRFLNRMKELVKLKQHQQYQARCENKETTIQKKSYSLSVSFQDIKKKAKKHWLDSQSFKKIIEDEQ